MFIISHRGNFDGVVKELENQPEHINKLLNFGITCEVDLWASQDKKTLKWLTCLGHDNPQYQVDSKFLKQSLYIHCKNVEALLYCKTHKLKNYFFHQRDHVTLTSCNHFWTYPDSKIPLIPYQSIPVVFNRADPIWPIEQLKKCYAVCTDDVNYYKKILYNN